MHLIWYFSKTKNQKDSDHFWQRVEPKIRNYVIIKSGFKSRAGYNGACTVITDKNSPVFSFTLKQSCRFLLKNLEILAIFVYKLEITHSSITNPPNFAAFMFWKSTVLHLGAQFYIQLLYRPHFGTWILPFGLWAVSEKFLKRRNFCLSMLLFALVFSCFHGQKIFF